MSCIDRVEVDILCCYMELKAKHPSAGGTSISLSMQALIQMSYVSDQVNTRHRSNQRGLEKVRFVGSILSIIDTTAPLEPRPPALQLFVSIGPQKLLLRSIQKFLPNQPSDTQFFKYIWSGDSHTNSKLGAAGAVGYYTPQHIIRKVDVCLYIVYTVF